MQPQTYVHRELFVKVAVKSVLLATGSRQPEHVLLSPLSTLQTSWTPVVVVAPLKPNRKTLVSTSPSP